MSFAFINCAVKNHRVDAEHKYSPQILTSNRAKKRIRVVVHCELVNSLIPFWKRKHNYVVLEGE